MIWILIFDYFIFICSSICKDIPSSIDLIDESNYNYLNLIMTKINVINHLNDSVTNILIILWISMNIVFDAKLDNLKSLIDYTYFN